MQKGAGGGFHTIPRKKHYTFVDVSGLEPYIKDAFKLKVLLELQRAEDRAREIKGLLPLYVHKPRNKGYCTGCGRPNDEQTKGCHNCEMRHYMRKRYKEQRG